MLVFLLVHHHHIAHETATQLHSSLCATKTCFTEVQSTCKYWEESWRLSENIKTTKRGLYITFPANNAFSCHRPILQSGMAPYVTLSSQILFNYVTTYLLSARCGNYCCLCLLFANNNSHHEAVAPLRWRSPFWQSRRLGCGAESSQKGLGDGEGQIVTKA